LIVRGISTEKVPDPLTITKEGGRCRVRALEAVGIMVT
jgi:hypothetical protein